MESASSTPSIASSAECVKFLALPGAYGGFAEHLRNDHGSKILYSSLPFEHCACGQLYASGESLSRHAAKCPCMHRRVSHEGCECAGCLAGAAEATPCTENCRNSKKSQLREVQQAIREKSAGWGHSSAKASNNATRALDREMSRAEQKSRKEVIDDILLEKSLNFVEENGLEDMYLTENPVEKSPANSKQKPVGKRTRDSRAQLARMFKKRKKEREQRSDLEKKGYTPEQLAASKQLVDMMTRLGVNQHPAVFSGPTPGGLKRAVTSEILTMLSLSRDFTS